MRSSGRAIILGAGWGHRLQLPANLSELEVVVCGKTLFQHAVTQLRLAGISDIWLVANSAHNGLQSEAKQSGVKVAVDSSPYGTFSSLIVVHQLLQEGVMVLEGDILFTQAHISLLAHAPYDDRTVWLTRYPTGPEQGHVFQLATDGTVLGVRFNSLPSMVPTGWVRPTGIFRIGKSLLLHITSPQGLVERFGPSTEFVIPSISKVRVLDTTSYPWAQIDTLIDLLLTDCSCNRWPPSQEIRYKVALGQNVPFLASVAPADRIFLSQQQLSLIHLARVKILGEERRDTRYLYGIREEEKLADSVAVHLLCYHSARPIGCARLRTAHGQAPWAGKDTPRQVQELGDFMYLDRLVVMHGFRGRGIAKGMLRLAEGFTRMVGLRYLVLSVDATNVGMGRLLQSQGFQIFLTRISLVGTRMKVWLKEIQLEVT